MGDWLKEDSIEKLRQIRAYHGDIDAVGRAANDEILRREIEDAKIESQRREAGEQQRHQELISLQKSAKNKPDEHWYNKPIGKIFITVAAGLLLLLIKYLLGF